MKRSLVFTLIHFITCTIAAQFDFELMNVSGINSTSDDIACTLWKGNVIMISNDRQDLVSDYRWADNRVFSMKVAEREKTFASFSSVSNLFSLNQTSDEGTACYNPGDSTLYFSSAHSYGKPKSEHLRIYSCEWNGFSWSTPQSLPFCKGFSNYAHPWFDHKNQLLVFSSDRAGGKGGMDIWFTYKIETGWTEPVCLDFMVNTSDNEIFPTIFNDAIYYASDGLQGFGGYDIFCALANQQWKVSVQLPAPINSEKDDLNMVFLNDERGFIASNREGGLGGDDVYLFNVVFETDPHNYTAQLVCSGTPVVNSSVSITNSLTEIILEGTTGVDGKFSLASLALNKKYRMRVTGVEPVQYISTRLFVYDEEGNKVMEFRMNADGSFDFELLPFDRIAGLAKPNMTDRSILQISLEGQVFREKPGDMGSNEMITIVDTRGETVAVAWTRDAGKFRVKDVPPEIAYTFQLSGNSKVGNIIVFDKGKELTLPVLNEEVHYQRMNENEAISLVNELNETIHIDPQDVFVINRIYYHYNSSELSEQSREQLKQLVTILKKNPGIDVELYSHTDAQGSEDYNLQLSKHRALMVANYLKAYGIAPSRIEATGMGESQLLNKCPDDYSCSEEERAINRRTEIRLVNTH
ncbi:MAG: OmpA family protein [Flavobacteriales bacterium]|nr:OmpA family protein [Flavobacteriales bacterium]